MIYFIQDTKSKSIKIGVSKNPLERLAHLQVAHPHPLHLVALMDGAEAEESALHTLFTRIGGEWFAPTRDLIVFIRQRAVSIHSLEQVRSSYYPMMMIDSGKPVIMRAGQYTPPNDDERAAIDRMIEYRERIIAADLVPTKSGAILAGFGVKRGGTRRYMRASEIYDATFGVPAPAIAARRYNPPNITRVV